MRKKPRLLITGASGFVGGHVAAAAKDHWEVWGTYKTHPFRLPEVQALPLDLSDPQPIRETIRAVRPDAILHCAGVGNVDWVETHPKEAFGIQVEATRTLCAEAEGLHIPILFTSSDMVFDGKKGGYRESDPVSPINRYGEYKAMAEEAVLASPWGKVARLALVYGRPLTGGHSFSEAIRSRIARKEEIFLFVDQFRTPILVQALARLLLEWLPLPGVRLLHLGGPDRIDRFRFAQCLATWHGLDTSGFRPVSMDDIPSPAPRPRDVSLCIEKAQYLLQTPPPGIEEGIREA